MNELESSKNFSLARFSAFFRELSFNYIYSNPTKQRPYTKKKLEDFEKFVNSPFILYSILYVYGQPTHPAQKRGGEGVLQSC